MELKGKSVAVLAADLYNEYELIYPYYRLLEAGARVLVVGAGDAKSYKSKVGLPVSVDAAVDEVSVDDFDGVVIPGGFAPDFMRRTPAMVEFVRQMHLGGKVVAAICHAGWMLASAEILQGRTVTSFFAIKPDMVHAGANWIDEECVVDGKLITARTPADLPAFMRAVVAALK